MSLEEEIEKTYLVAHIPIDLKGAKSKKIVDVYIPGNLSKPSLRLRQSGDVFTLTKKVKIDPHDASTHTEHTIPLTSEEFVELRKNGKEIEKTRYYFDFQDQPCKLDVFEGKLAGLVIADFEFRSPETYQKFIQPDFCLIDITQEDFIAGKNLAGKSVAELKIDLDRLNYTLII